MKVIILAAGTGSRLGMDIPKALVELVNGTTILDFQLANISRVLSLDDVILVLGFKKDIFDKKYHYIRSVYNPEYETTNTSKSLLLALESIENEDVIFMNGDVVFDPEILSAILKNKTHNLVCVNNASVDEEEVKYSLDENGFIKRISKSVTNPMGEAVGINYIRSKDIEALKACLSRCDNEDYFEKGFEMAIEDGMKFSPLNIEKKFCVEIDFIEDLNKVKQYLKDVNEN